LSLLRICPYYGFVPITDLSLLRINVNPICNNNNIFITKMRTPHFKYIIYTQLSTETIHRSQKTGLLHGQMYHTKQ